MTGLELHVAELLTRVPMFRDLSAELRLACAKSFHGVRFNKGRMIFARGDRGAQLYLVGSGQVRLAVATSEGRELSFQVAQEGSMFGEIAVLDGGPRSAEATAISEVALYALAGEELRRLRETHAAVNEAVIAYLCGRLREVSEKLETIALYPLPVRIARLLVASLGANTGPAGKRVALELRFSQSELAQLIGATRSKTNKALDTLEKTGAIKRTQDRLFCDPAALAALSESFDGTQT